MSTKKKHTRSPAVTALLWVLLVAYLLLLFRVILFKFPIRTVLDILMDKDELEFTRVNLIPFQTIRFYLFSGRVSFIVAARNILGNILAFVPLGILIPLIRRKLSVVFTLLTALAISASIELTQLYTGLGSCDVDDLILNVFGAMLTCLVLSSLDIITYLVKTLIKKCVQAIDKATKKR